MTTPFHSGPIGLCYDPAAACHHLTTADPVLGRLILRVGPCTLRPKTTQSLFASLFQAIVNQQLSGKAAATILGRVIALYAPKRFPTPSDILETAPAQLRAAGLSAAKTAAVRDLAAQTLDRTVPPMARARRMTDDELVDRLTQVRGIGRWTVEMLLLFRLGRPDVFPVADLGIKKGFARTFRRPGLPTPESMIRRAERWRPYRSVASWYLWRGIDG